ncbi:MAG: hypothetical protein ACD_57C00153G0001 [uncultured bacterium]|nr:MAG: hypothetical protein ACD_57C00153G0001 [uncultured bacterium]
MKVFQNGQRLRAQGKNGIDLEQPLVGRVLVYDLAKVLDLYVSEYPRSLGAFFYNSQALIDEMIDYARPWLEVNSTWAGKPVDHSKLAAEFVQKWVQFKENFRI